MKRQLVALGTSVVLLVGVACSGGADGTSAEPLALEAWAASICETEEAFIQTLNRISDGSDPSGLTLAQRKERTQLRISLVREAAIIAGRDLDVEGPRGTTSYTAALLAEVVALVDALEVQQQEIREADTLRDLERSNAQRNGALVAVEAAAVVAADDLSVEVRAALYRVDRCGAIRDP